MLGAIERLRERVGDDFQQRDHYYPDALFELESWDSPISIMFRYWLDLRGGRFRVPEIDAFQPGKLWELKIPHHVALIDCSTEDPCNFFVQSHPYDIVNKPWLFGKPASGLRTGAVPSRLHSRSVQTDYQAAKACETRNLARYSRITQVVNGVFRDYTRLLLPFAGPRGDITMLASATRMHQPASRDPASFPRISVN
ncbi:MAG: hypothetical protein HOA08_03940 [Rhodospirillaceae bacterium]|jgi:hypothetical protein|nr:hypothetical protein [Rhodospirillaceae bacterium]MBT3491039.1 hypothetical protein [Rhodospirillaceae bacterium]MBT3781694.1 hypothetical protein [Rhodospirillaceae bacterium]MBT3975270.1 hypothetical protein [Rhodospirillaceae bacterium]MBT4170928.1 hypothetical protein [Rhodospirillaceae bacterium]